MRTLVTLLAGLALATPAQAARHEISLELGVLENSDDAHRLYSDSELMTHVGLRAGAAVYTWNDKLGITILGSWGRSKSGQDVSFFDEETFGGNEVRAALISDVFTVGPKVDWDLWGFFFPYVTAQGVLVRASSKLDDNSQTVNNPGQVATQALAGGAQFTGGVELMLPDKRWGWPVTAGWYLEGGYAVVSSLNFDGLGDMKPGGLVIRTGVGLRF